MPYLSDKPGKPQRWTSQQVAYGIDCSDPKPENWTAFGRLAEQTSTTKPPKPQEVARKTPD